MESIDLKRVAEALSNVEPRDATVRVELPEHANGSLHIAVDGPEAATSICLWPGGVCEVTCALTAGGESQPAEFQLEQDTAATVVSGLVREAVARSMLGPSG